MGLEYQVSVSQLVYHRLHSLCTTLWFHVVRLPSIQTSTVHREQKTDV